MTMSTETTTQKRKTRKTFNEIVQEIRTILSKTKAVYIQEMCEALRDEHPDWENKKIQDKVEDTCDEFGWNPNTVYVYLPSWIHNQKASIAGRKVWERKHQEEQIKNRKILMDLAKQSLQPPEIKARSYTPQEEDEGPDVSIEDEVPLIRPLGDEGDAIYDLYKNINVPARELFRGLTKKEMPAGLVDDLLLDYMKPSREFRNKIFYEVDDRMLTSLYNALNYTKEAIEDTLDLIDHIHSKKKGGLTK